MFYLKLVKQFLKMLHLLFDLKDNLRLLTLRLIQPLLTFLKRQDSLAMLPRFYMDLRQSQKLLGDVGRLPFPLFFAFGLTGFLV